MKCYMFYLESLGLFVLFLTGMGHSQDLHADQIDGGEDSPQPDPIDPNLVMPHEEGHHEQARVVEGGGGRRLGATEELGLGAQTVLALQELGVVLAVTTLVALLFLLMVGAGKAAAAAKLRLQSRSRSRMSTAVAVVTAVQAAHGFGGGGGGDVVVRDVVLSSGGFETHPAALVGTFKPCKN